MTEPTESAELSAEPTVTDAAPAESGDAAESKSGDAATTDGK